MNDLNDVQQQQQQMKQAKKKIRCQYFYIFFFFDSRQKIQNSIITDYVFIMWLNCIVIYQMMMMMMMIMVVKLDHRFSSCLFVLSVLLSRLLYHHHVRHCIGLMCKSRTINLMQHASILFFFRCVCPEIHHFVSVKLFLVLRCSCICVSI